MKSGEKYFIRLQLYPLAREKERDTRIQHTTARDETVLKLTWQKFKKHVGINEHVIE